MKKIIFFLVFIILVAVGICWLKRADRPASAQKPVIITSGYVPYILAREMSGGLVPVQMLLPPGAEPHGFEPSPGSLIAVHNARAFVYVSDKLEPWVKDVLGAAGKDTRVVALADGLPPSEDPHVWMNFSAAVDMARALVQMLSEIDPPNSSVYEKNLKQFEQQIAILDMDYARGLSSCESREIVHVGHLAFGALAKRYQLQLTALAGTSHDGEHSARKLSELVKHIRAARVKTLFTEQAVSPRLAQTVAAETGAQILPLYTVEDVSKADFNRGITYEEFMRRNLASLQEGLTCQK